MASGPITACQTEGEKVEAVTDFLFLGTKITVDSDCSLEIRRWLLLGRRVTTNLDSMLKSRDITLPIKVRIVKAMVFQVVPYGCEGWTVKKAESQKKRCLRTMVLEKIPQSPLDSKEIKPVNCKGNQPWIPVGSTDAETEAPVFWSPDVNSWLIRKVPDAGKDGGQTEKRASENKIAGWHHWWNEMNLGKLPEMVRDREAWQAAVHGIAKSQTQLELGDRTTTTASQNSQFHHFPSGDSAILMLIKCSCFYPCAFWWFFFFLKKQFHSLRTVLCKYAFINVVIIWCKWT